MGRSTRIQDVRFIIANSSGDSECLKAKHETWRICRLDHIHVNVQRHWLHETWGILQTGSRKDSRKDNGRSSVLEMKRSGMELFFIHLKENGTTATQMVEPFKDTSHPVFKSFSAFESGNSEKKWQRHHTLQCGRFKHGALIPNHSFCKSAQYLRSSPELVWAIRFDWGRKGTRKTSWMERIGDQRCIVKSKLSRSKTFGIFSKTCIWTQFTAEHGVMHPTKKRATHSCSCSTWGGWRNGLHIKCTATVPVCGCCCRLHHRKILSTPQAG